MTTKMIGGKDRCHYRTLSNAELIEEAKYYPSIELCIALGERVEKMERRLEAYRYDYEAERSAYDY